MKGSLTDAELGTLYLFTMDYHNGHGRGHRLFARAGRLIRHRKITHSLFADNPTAALMKSAMYRHLVRVWAHNI